MLEKKLEESLFTFSFRISRKRNQWHSQIMEDLNNKHQVNLIEYMSAKQHVKLIMIEK